MHSLPAAAFSSRFSDPDELAQALRVAEVEYIRLSSEAYDARLTRLQLGPLTLQHVQDQAHIARAFTNRDSVTLLLPVSAPAGEVTVNGHSVVPGHAILLGPNSPLTGVCAAAQDWATVTLPTEQFTALTDHWGVPDAREGSDQLLRMEGGAFTGFARSLAMAAEAAASDPAALAEPGAAGAMAGPLHDALWSLAGRFGRDLDGTGRAARDGMRILRQCEEYLREHIGRPIYSDELCRVVGVSPRKLHTAFVAVTGMSPLAYLKRRRLALVRRALRSGQGDARLVKSIALAHGFWHLGNFAHDYRQLFAEAPSETLGRARHGA